MHPVLGNILRAGPLWTINRLLLFVYIAPADSPEPTTCWSCTIHQGLKLEEPECIVRRFSMAWRWCYDVKLPAKLFQFPFFFFALSPCFPWKPQALRKASCKTLIICRLLLLVRRKMFADFLPRITREATCGRLGRKQQQTTVRKSRIWSAGVWCRVK